VAASKCHGAASRRVGVADHSEGPVFGSMLALGRTSAYGIRCCCRSPWKALERLNVAGLTGDGPSETGRPACWRSIEPHQFQKMRTCFRLTTQRRGALSNPVNVRRGDRPAAPGQGQGSRVGRSSKLDRAGYCRRVLRVSQNSTYCIGVIVPNKPLVSPSGPAVK